MTPRRILLAVAALGALASVPAHAADVGVSVQISQPGVFGRIDIGRFPQPVLVSPQPVIIAPPAPVYAPPPPPVYSPYPPVAVVPAPVVVAQPQPVYMWVPAEHRHHWARECGRYRACGVPVVFVQDRWYREHVMAGRGPGPRGYYASDRDDGPRGHAYGRHEHAYADGDRDRGHGHGHDRGD